MLDAIGVDANAFVGAVLLLIRASAMVVSAPVLGGQAVPGRVRLALAVAFTIVGVSAADFPAAPSLTLSFLVLGAIKEAVIGLSAGFAAKVFIDAAQAAGEIAGLGMGMGMAMVLDPLTGSQASPLGRLWSVMAIAVAVAFGLHREAAAWVAQSAIHVGPGAPGDFTAFLQAVLGHALASVVLAVRVGFPVLAAVTFGHIGLGMIGRVAPQMSLQSLGMSVAILTGGFALWSVTPEVALITARKAAEVFSTLH